MEQIIGRKKKFTCTICRLIFPSWAQRTRHLRRAHGSVMEKAINSRKKKLLSKEIDWESYNLDELTKLDNAESWFRLNHPTFMHKNPVTELYDCYLCERHFEKDQSLMRHYREDHCEVRFRCPVCRCKFTKSQIGNHCKDFFRYHDSFDHYTSTIFQNQGNYPELSDDANILSASQKIWPPATKYESWQEYVFTPY